MEHQTISTILTGIARPMRKRGAEVGNTEANSVDIEMLRTSFFQLS